MPQFPSFSYFSAYFSVISGRNELISMIFMLGNEVLWEIRAIKCHHNFFCVCVCFNCCRLWNTHVKRTSEFFRSMDNSFVVYITLEVLFQNTASADSVRYTKTIYRSQFFNIDNLPPRIFEKSELQYGRVRPRNFIFKTTIFAKLRISRRKL